MAINSIYGGSPEQAEIEISGSNSDLVALGKQLTKPELINLVDVLPIINEYFSHPIKEVVFTVADFNHDKMVPKLIGNRLEIFGTKIAFSNFGQGLLNCYEDNNHDGYHIHYDYLEGYGELGPTKHSLIITLSLGS